MISYQKLGSITYHNLSKDMISYDTRVAVFPKNVLFFHFFFFSFSLMVSYHKLGTIT